MSQPGGDNNLGRYRTPSQCFDCGSTTHRRVDCPTHDTALGEQIRTDEAAAVDEIAKALTTKVLRAGWVRAVLAGFRKAHRIEEQTDARELTDFLRSAMSGGVKRYAK